MNKLSNKKRAFLFQGVGADYRDLLDKFDKEQLEYLKQYCSTVNEEIGIDLYAYLINSEDKESVQYDKMFYDWIAIYTCDYIVYQHYDNSGIRPAMMVGYSMGLITAMACGKSISFAAGLRMLQTIYEYPKGHADLCSMGVIVGKTYSEICDIIVHCKTENDVYIASENNDTCLVISGIKDSVHQVLKIAEQEGAIKASTINTPYAFHSPYAARGIDMFVNLVEKTTICDGEIPIVSVFTQTVIQSASDLKDELIKNMASPMNWNASILKLGEWGVNHFVEVSLDDSLTKISRLINLDYEFLTYKKFIRLKSTM
ncbi:ACP S-malonyltransferase [Paenibacillus sp. UMB4589-SE434]|uniref:ACP S-malonyltransferase n=1 Tax=Paenibacillus sp. UMB4589-SE434 TaxID=3046314 RepID=UPI00254A1666|nr:ACP S-malonyltransferase [Paenibacillus sp. UMB4589-SE434]MDK8180282.1 ACP S-malonyltransferase [Paenibacillus sp. UMB4589-SE434]